MYNLIQIILVGAAGLRTLLLMQHIMKRILLKISGEAFSGEAGAIDMISARKLGDFIKYFFLQDYEIAIVVGG